MLSETTSFKIHLSRKRAFFIEASHEVTFGNIRGISDMVYYIESPTINKKMVAGYYLFLALVGFALLLGPTGAGIPITVIDATGRDHELAYPGYGTYMDPTSCDAAASCHGDEYIHWNSSEHAHSVTIVNSTHYRIGDTNVSIITFNSTCSPCHTSGWDNSTGTPSYEALNINCFRCHNSSGYVDYAGDVCGECHRPIFDQPNQHPDWLNSGHADSLSDLRASDHAASYCMHCMSGEGFIYQQNPAMIGSQVDLEFDPDGDYNTVSCPACHAVHANWTTAGPHSIRAVNSSELCILCHQGLNIWYGGSHNLAGVECVNCHGFDYAIDGDSTTYFMNHTFVVDPDLACGQSDDCHIDSEAWALNQLDLIGNAFDALVEEIKAEATALETIISAYNGTASANVTHANYVQGIIDEVVDLVDDLEGDDSHGFHNPTAFTAELNEAYQDLLNAKTYFYEYLPAETIDNGTTITETVTNFVTILGGSELLMAGALSGGLLIGILVGVLLGRRD